MQMCIHMMYMTTVSCVYCGNIKEKILWNIQLQQSGEDSMDAGKGMYRNLLTGEKTELKDIRLSGYEFLWYGN